jgi:hypothetical protein
MITCRAPYSIDRPADLRRYQLPVPIIHVFQAVAGTELNLQRCQEHVTRYGASFPAKIIEERYAVATSKA